jgi:probable HAF family extracellular repeat protein
MTDLGTLGGTDSVAHGVNAAGDVVGTLTTAAGYPEGFSYAGGSMTPISYSSGYNYTVRVSALAINAAGDILVNAVVFDGLTTAFPVFLLRNGNYSPLADYLTYTCTTLATGNVIPVWSQFQGLGFNDAGAAVGVYVACPLYGGPNVAWSSDKDVALTLPVGQTPSRALGINNSNTVVGEYTVAAGLHAFVTTPLAGPLDLNSAVDPGVLTTGEVLTSASAVNDSGVIVAQSNLGHAYSLVPSRFVASFIPATLSFGSQSVNSTGMPQAVAYGNSGTGSVSIDGVTVPAGFSQANDCGGSLASGANCTIRVSFAPQAPGVYYALVTVTASGVLYRVASVSGTATFSATIVSSAVVVAAGNPVTLSWSSFKGASCATTGGASGDNWAGRRLGDAGSLPVTEPPGTYAYSIQCAYAGVTTPVAQVVVNVRSQPVPTIPPGSSGGGGGGSMDLGTLLALGAALCLGALRRLPGNQSAASRRGEYGDRRLTAWRPSEPPKGGDGAPGASGRNQAGVLVDSCLW